MCFGGSRDGVWEWDGLSVIFPMFEGRGGRFRTEILCSLWNTTDATYFLFFSFL